VLAGAGLAVVTLAVNLFGLGHFSGFGPAKQAALAAAVAVILFGLSLLPLGDRPA
jgi:Ni/Fe-hydrogenase subunit HybB-like protein